MSVADVSALLYLPDHPRQKLERILRVEALSPGWQESFRALLEADANGTPNGNAGLSAEQPAAWAGFRRLTVVSRTRESDDVKSFVLGSDLPPFLPGQHIVVRVDPGLGKQRLSRNYSLAGAPSTGTFLIGVKREVNGVVSGFIHESLKVGDTVDVSAPRGTFTLTEGNDPVVLISAGIGITPMLAMLYSIAESKGGSNRPVWWVYGARDGAHHPFVQETRKLLGTMANVRSCVAYSRPASSDQLGVAYDMEGHVTTQMLDKLGAPKSADFYLCGPASFNTSLSRALKAWGGEGPRIHIEAFGPGESLTPGVLDAQRRKPHAPDGQQADGPKVSFAKSALTVSWGSHFQSLLELAEACDVPVRWSCRTGVCHTCECGLIDGSVAYSPDPLDPPSQGSALICCSMPRGDIELDL